MQCGVGANVFPPAGRIVARFIFTPSFCIQIHRTMKTALQNKPASRPPFQINARNESPVSYPKINLNRTRNPSGKPTSELKETEFFLEAPSAKSVKLAGDFTNWEKFPLDMIQSEEGVWFAVIPLSPGNYSYRFIVDGQWHDDPRSAQRVPNPFGSSNAVKNVT